MERTRCPLCDADDFTPVVATTAHMVSGSSEVFRFVRCRQCGLVYLNPRVPQSELGRYYPDYYLPYRGPEAWGRFAPIAVRGERLTDARRARVAARALRTVQRHRSHSSAPWVLDVGCGRPSFLAALRDRSPATRCTGIDFVSSGWDDDPERWPGIELKTVEPQQYMPGKDSPDVITMWHYLEHDYDPRRTLAHLRGISHQSTRLVVEVPDFDSLSRWVYGDRWQGYHAPRHTALYTGKTLTDLLQRSGWKVYSHSHRGTLDIFALWWMSAMERRAIDWSQSMESRFPGFLAGRILTTPLVPLTRVVPAGVQLVTAYPKTG